MKMMTLFDCLMSSISGESLSRQKIFLSSRFYWEPSMQNILFLVGRVEYNLVRSNPVKVEASK